MSQTDFAVKYLYQDIEQQCEVMILHKVADNAPAHFHLTSGGSRTRAKLCIHTGMALQLPIPTILFMAGAIELLHNASLVHDDIQDGDEHRRGVHSAWKKYGKGRAICAGDLMISAAYSLLAEIPTSDRTAILFAKLHNAVANTIKGQDMDLNTSSLISDRDYENIASLKSGPLIQLTMSLPLLMAGCPHVVANADRALSQFSVAYQILDDMQDWQQDRQRNQLNLVNLIASRSSLQQAMLAAGSRVHYLLKQCQKALSVMPNHCGTSIIDTATLMLVKTDALLATVEKGDLIV